MLGLAVALLPHQATAQSPASRVVVDSEARRFRLVLSGLARTEPINHLHGFDLFLTDSSNRPVVGASISLSGERLYSPNPLPTAPQVQPGATPGAYRVEGLRFHMGGRWRLVFAIELAHIRDRAIVELEAE